MNGRAVWTGRAPPGSGAEPPVRFSIVEMASTHVLAIGCYCVHTAYRKEFAEHIGQARD